jgi:hypothetical protein
MKKSRTLTRLVLLVALASCAKVAAEHEHGVVFDVTADQILADVTKSNVSDYTVLPKADEFVLTITDADGALFWSGKSAEWDPATKIKAGGYTVKASYGSIEDEGFDKPCFEGVSAFEVKGKETTHVEIPASLANTVIKVSCTEAFKNYYKDYTFKLERNNSEIVTFVKDETKAAFIDGYRVTVSGVLTTETGAEKTFSQEYTALAAATAYNMVFDVAGTGSGAVTITFNNTVETVELGDVELND